MSAMCSPTIKPYIKYMGILAQHKETFPRDKLLKLFKQGDLTELEEKVPEPQVAAVVDMLHHCLPHEMTATVVLGEFTSYKPESNTCSANNPTPVPPPFLLLSPKSKPSLI